MLGGGLTVQRHRKFSVIKKHVRGKQNEETLPVWLVPPDHYSYLNYVPAVMGTTSDRSSISIRPYGKRETKKTHDFMRKRHFNERIEHTIGTLQETMNESPRF